jgi:phosphoribosylanthranilate isomerase
MQVKICGITNLDDALCVCENGADAMGFIFFPKSPRYITPEEAKEIIKNLPGGIAKVGVFVNKDAGEVEKIVEFCGLDFIQLHGDETPDYCRKFSASILIKAFSPKSEGDLEALKDYDVRAVLVDTFDPKMYGGTGRTSNWELALKIRKAYPLILSGGLNEHNIENAIKIVSPHAVDINSGVESSPGKKDHEKIGKVMDIIRKNDIDAGISIFGSGISGSSGKK